MPPRQRRRGAARQPEPAPARRLRRRRVRHAEPRPLRAPGRCASPSTTPARCRACRRATTSCAARSTSCGGRGARSRSGRTPITRPLRARRRHHPADHRPPAPVRDRRRELPHRLHAPGTTSAATRATRGGRGPTRAGSARRRFGRGRMPYDNSRGWFRGEADFPGPRTHGRGGALARRQRRRTTTASCCSSTSSIPHEPFDTPEPYASLYDPDWEGPHLIWPPYVRGARARRACSTSARRARSAPGTAPS